MIQPVNSYSVPGLSPLITWVTPAVGSPDICAAYPPREPALTTTVFSTCSFHSLRLPVKSPSATRLGPVGPGVPTGADAGVPSGVVADPAVSAGAAEALALGGAD